MTTGRVQHLLSDIEFRSFLLFDWAQDAVDIRGQFPLDRDATQRIVESTGISHPCDVATRTPLVMTTDLVIDMERQERVSLVETERRLAKLGWIGKRASKLPMTTAAVGEVRGGA